MTDINPTRTRSSFFPERNKPSVKGRQAIPNSLRNDVSRSKEIKEGTKADVKIKLPDSIKDYSRIKSAVDRAEPLDNSLKVEMIKKQIKEGTYRTDFDALADKILSQEF